MRIGTSHRNKIWKALVEFHSESITISDSQSLQRDVSTASTISMTSQASISQNSQNSTYCPGYYEVTRYTFKHTVSYTKVDERSPKRAKVDWYAEDLCHNQTRLDMIGQSFTVYWTDIYRANAIWCTNQCLNEDIVIWYFVRPPVFNANVRFCHVTCMDLLLIWNGYLLNRWWCVKMLVYFLVLFIFNFCMFSIAV